MRLEFYRQEKKMNWYKLFAKIFGYPEYAHFLKLDRISQPVYD